jgi:hypothetical protein
MPIAAPLARVSGIWLNQIRAEVVRNLEKILEAWYEHCAER